MQVSNQSFAVLCVRTERCVLQRLFFAVLLSRLKYICLMGDPLAMTN